MKRATVLKHVPFEGPGRIAERLTKRGYELELRELHRGEPVPEAVASGDLLVVMGGPMGVADVGAPEFPFLRPELELLARCIEVDAPVLGVCLGAQLLAAAAGARVEPMKHPDGRRAYEIGWASLSFLHEGAHDALLAGLPARAPVLHWHGDAFELPGGARRLAATELCPNQAFALRSRLFGLQFHCEVGAADVDGFLQSDAAFVQRVLGDSAAARIQSDTRRYIDGFEVLGDRLLDNLLDAMTRG
jgi:GMP synthase-like glutamine amidotransferase